MGNSALAVRRVNSFDENVAQKSQKSILAFFGKSVSTSSDNETPTKPLNKEETKASSPVVHNSPLKEPNRNQDEDSLDSPIKTTKKRSSIAKRLDSSSDEEPENGSPEPSKQESPKKKAAPKKASKRKSSPSSNEKKAKKTKNQEEQDKKEEVKQSPDKEVKEEPKPKAKKRSPQEKDALPKKARKTTSKKDASPKVVLKAATSPEKSNDLKVEKSPKYEEKVLSPKKEKASPKKKSPSPKKESPKKIKESPKTDEKTKKVNPFAAMMGKSPSLNDSTSNSKIQEYEEIVKKSKYDPI